jgi:hypothetical protein
METVLEESDDRGPARIARRDSLFLLTSFTTPDGVSLGNARVRNLSATGLMADCEAGISRGQPVIIELRGVGQVLGAVAWVREGRVGIVFDSPIDPQLARKPISTTRQGLPDYLRTPDFSKRR